MKKTKTSKKQMIKNMQMFKISKKQLIKNLVLISLIYVFALLSDQLSKTFVFQWNWNHTGANGLDVANWGIIAFRSVGNNGAMLGLWAGHTALIQTIAIFVTLITLFFALFSKSALLTVGLAFLGAGSLGNVLDRIMFDGMVKDILYAPYNEWWSNRGTFNLADTWVVVGAALFFIYTVIQLFKKEQ